jgi:hypothetical protein
MVSWVVNSRLHSRPAVPQASSLRNLSRSAHSAFSRDPFFFFRPSTSDFQPRHPPKFFSCNTYGSPRKCCKQKTYGLTKPFRCNTYEKHRGRVLSIGTFRPSDLPTCFPSIPILFTFLRTLLHFRKIQLFSFQAIPHSLPKTPGGVYPHPSHSGTQRLS